jgi:hypothetical protein
MNIAQEQTTPRVLPENSATIGTAPHRKTEQYLFIT